MKVIKYNKLVRDGMIVLLSRKGVETTFRVAAPEERWSLLVDKLREEATEFRTSGNIEELADLLEAMHSFAEIDGVPFGHLYQYLLPQDLREVINGVGFEKVEELRLQKLAERGGYQDWFVLLETREEKKPIYKGKA